MSNSRRFFIKSIGAGVLLAQLPLLSACHFEKTSQIENLDQNQKIFYDTLSILFPKYKNSPTIDQLNTLKHLQNYLSDKNIDPDEQIFLTNGIDWLDETAQEDYKKAFLDLSSIQKQDIISKIVKESWGESWLSKLLTLTFESLLLDPIYDININKAGWQWLHHHPGQPRPQKTNQYPKILDRKKENIIITNLKQL
jgi:hypothetical protein